MKPLTSIYLAGATCEKEYRKYTKLNYCNYFNLIDPLDLVDNPILNKWKINDEEIAKYQTLPDNTVSSIVEQDKKYISKCDLLVAYIQNPSFGTAMEIEYAYNLNIPIYIINPNNLWKNDIWLRYHSNFIFSLENKSPKENIDYCFKTLK